jgi:molybdate transport system substrate-binding protein
MQPSYLPFLALILVLASGRLLAAGHSSVSIAAAANFVYALDALNSEFKRHHAAIRVTSTTGASGSLFAQITNGAPFDVFLSADTDYPEQLVAAGLGLRSTQRVFATGRIVAWTIHDDLDLQDLARMIRLPSVKKIALAQPRNAPYGRAAQSALEVLGLWHDAQPKLVFGESIAQAAQFVETGNADLGFVALSFVLSPRLAKQGQWQEIPPEWYEGTSLDHAALLTTRGAANPAARRYLEFLGSDAAKKILRDFGYGVPR